MKAIIQRDMQLLGTSLGFKKGDLVIATKAKNLPNPNAYFVRPVNGKWCDGYKRSVEDSMVVDSEDLYFDIH